MPSVLLTGETHVGKSTLIRRVLARHPEWRVGGFVTLCRGDGVYILPAEASARFFAPSNRVGRRQRPCFSAFPAVFDAVGAPLLQTAQGDLVLMDELGFMESDAPLFQQAVLDVLSSPVSVLGVVKPARTPFLDRVRACPNCAIFQVAPDNRDQLPDAVDACLSALMK